MTDPDKAACAYQASLVNLPSLDLGRWLELLRELSLDAATDTLPFVQLDTAWWMAMRPAVREMLEASAEAGEEHGIADESHQRVACAVARMEEALGVAESGKLIVWGRERGVGGDIVGAIGAGSVALFSMEVSASVSHDVEPYNWLRRDLALQPFVRKLLHLYGVREDLENVIFTARCRWPTSAWDEQCETYWQRKGEWHPDSLLLRVREIFDHQFAAWFWQESNRVLSPLQRRRLTRTYVREYPEFKRLLKWGVRFLEELVVPDSFLQGADSAR